MFSFETKETTKMIRLIITFAIFSLVSSLNVPSDELINEISHFSSNLYEQCAKSASNENLIISPFSIATAVAFLSQATNGRTFDQIKQILNLKIDKTSIANQFSSLSETLEKNSGHAIFSIANKIYVQQDYKINPNFQIVANEQFKSNAESVNFMNKNVTAVTINDFVEEKTNGKIKNLFDASTISSDTNVVLVNAIHFRGDWEKKFYEIDTIKDDFYISDTEMVSVDFMNINEYLYFADLPTFEAKALQLNYAKSNFSMIFVLPNSHTELTTMQSKMKGHLISIMNQLKRKKVNVSIPKFIVEFKINLNDVLQNMGITDIFTNNADLNGLLETKEPVKLSEVVHKCFILVSEGGTEAAGATGFKIRPLSALNNVSTFHANHPFMYFVVDKISKTIIFSGQIKNFN